MTLLTTMLDFTDTGEIGLLIDEQSVAAREAAIGQGGLLKGSELAQVFAALRANDLIWPYVVNGYLKGKAPPAFDLLFWNGDDTNLPGPMFCWYLRNTYLENKLREPGGTDPVRRAGRPGRGRRAGVPLRLARGPHRALADGLREHAAAGRRHHLRARRQRPHRRRDQPAGEEKRNYWVGDDRAPTPRPGWSTRRRRARQLVAGLERLARAHAGDAGASAQDAWQRQFTVIEPAPGRYVKAKAP